MVVHIRGIATSGSEPTPGAAPEKHVSGANRTTQPILEANDHSLFPALLRTPCTGIPLPVRGSIIAVVGEEVKVQFPEDMQGDAAIGGRHVMVGFSEHGVEAV